MTYLTNVEYRNGRLAARSDNSADAKHDLPKVGLTDRLGSDQWSVGFERELKPHGHHQDPSLSSALRVQSEMVKGTKSLLAQRENQHPNDTQSLHLDKLNKSYDKFIQSAAQQNDRARNTLRQRLQQVDAEFRETVGFNDRDNPLIKQRLASMEDIDRVEAIQHAIAHGKGAILNAIFDAEPFAIGLTDEQQQAYRQQALNRHRPDLHALERELKRADDLVFNSFNDLLSIGDTLTAAEVRAKYAEQTRKAAEAQTFTGF